MKLSIYTKAGSKTDKSISLATTVFEQTPNPELLNLAYRAYLANGRVASARTLTRAEVSGGGKKPWKQKGTGRARVGSSRVPNWRHGGVVFGATGDENYSIKLSVTTKRTAIAQALSAQASESRITLLESFDASLGKVRPTIELIAGLGLVGKVLLVVENKDAFTVRATRNVAGLKVVVASYLNVFDLLNADQIIMTKASVEVIEKWLSGSASEATETKPKATVGTTKTTKAADTKTGAQAS
jgi:large subunit ribosomal protein L4